MALLTRDEILAADDLPFEDVPVPEWGGTVRVFALTGQERAIIEAKFAGKKGEGQIGLKEWLIACSVGDESRNMIFQPEDVEALKKKSGAAVNRVAEVALRLAGMSKADQEELEKN